MLKVANSVISASRITGTLPVANGGTGVTTSTGTGNTVLSNNPTFTSVNATGVISALSGGTATAQINASPIANEGAFLMSTAPGQFRLSGGCVYNAPDWKARSTEAVIVGHDSGGSFVVYTDSGLTIGNTFSPTARTTTSSTGLAVTGTLSGTGYSFSGSAPASSLTLDANGNLGVGTATPASFGCFGVAKAITIGSVSVSAGFSDSVTGTLRIAHASNQNILNFDTTALCFQSGGSSSPTERMRISDAGIVTMSAYGAGAATFSSAGVISSVSDETWKIKDGVPTDPDAMLKKLKPGYWYYNDEKKETFGSDRQLGFYAQNVNAAIGPEAAPKPETFTTKNEDGTETITTKPWGYYDRSVLAVTVMSLQKALKTIELLTARVAALEAK